MNLMALLCENWFFIVMALVVLVVISGFMGTCQHEPSAELARATRNAIEMARESQEANDAAYLWPGRLRLLGTVIGVSVPIGGAAWIVYLVLRHRPENLDVAAHVLKARLPAEGREVVSPANKTEGTAVTPGASGQPAVEDGNPSPDRTLDDK
jgi:hypothetical protein